MGDIGGSTAPRPRDEEDETGVRSQAGDGRAKEKGRYDREEGSCSRWRVAPRDNDHQTEVRDRRCKRPQQVESISTCETPQIARSGRSRN